MSARSECRTSLISRSSTAGVKDRTTRSNSARKSSKTFSWKSFEASRRRRVSGHADNSQFSGDGGAPVEQDGGSGTAGSYWDEGIFTNEITTGYINPSNYISDVTWASLADLGYKLNPYPDYLLA